MSNTNKKTGADYAKALAERHDISLKDAKLLCDHIMTTICRIIMEGDDVVIKDRFSVYEQKKSYPRRKNISPKKRH